MEAMEKIKAGERFNSVAEKYSEDKARQGVCASSVWVRWGGGGWDVEGQEGVKIKA